MLESLPWQQMELQQVKVKVKKLAMYQFYSVFADEDLSSVSTPTRSFPIMPNIFLNVEGIYKIPNDLDVDKAPAGGSDNEIPNRSILNTIAMQQRQLRYYK